MAARLGGRSSGGDDLEVNHEINVTPFIDVMLVLLIIFMVVTPMLQKGAAPPPPPGSAGGTD